MKLLQLFSYILKCTTDYCSLVLSEPVPNRGQIQEIQQMYNNLELKLSCFSLWALGKCYAVMQLFHLDKSIVCTSIELQNLGFYIIRH